MNAPPPGFAEGEFRKARASQPNKSCVQVARRDGWVEIRDDKTTFGAVNDHRIVFNADEFDHFLTSVRAGTTEGLCLEMEPRADGTHAFRRADGSGDELEFTDSEVAAFLDGVHAGEFDAAAYAV
jgi:imidazolonepropionase-like amidohydrolase